MASFQVQTISFLDLPAELRNKIYEYCLSASAIIECSPVISTYRLLQRARDQITDSPQLLRVCRLVNAEATPLFYSSKTIRIHARTGCRTDLRYKFKLEHIWQAEIRCSWADGNLRSLLSDLSCITWLRQLHLPFDIYESQFSWLQCDRTVQPRKLAAWLQPLMLSLLRSGRSKTDCIEILEFYPSQGRPSIRSSHRNSTSKRLAELERGAMEYLAEVVEHLESLLPNDEDILIVRLRVRIPPLRVGQGKAKLKYKS